MDASYKIQRGIHVHLIQFFMCPEFWVHISVTSVFLRHVAEAHEMASNSGVATLRNFCWPQARKNACWGAPQTRRTSGQIVPKSRRYAPIVCGLSLSLLSLIFLSIYVLKMLTTFLVKGAGDINI